MLQLESVFVRHEGGISEAREGRQGEGREERGRGGKGRGVREGRGWMREKK